MRIIIVEDEVKIRVGMGKLIEKQTCHEIIGEAKNGQEGLEMVLRHKPDLIITDIRMPEMDGLEMLTKLREQGVYTPAVILSGYAEFDYARKAISLGVNDYLLKPIGVEDVTDVLQSIEKKLEEEVENSGSVENCIREIYLGNNETAESAYNCLQRQWGFPKAGRYFLGVGYIGAACVSYKEEFDDVILRLKNRYTQPHIYMAPVDKMQEILLVGYFTEEEERQEFFESFEHKMLKGRLAREKRAVWGAGRFEEIKQLQQEMKKIQKLLPYGMLLGNEGLITEEAVRAVYIEEFIYPREIENRMKASLCRENAKDLEQIAEEFMEYFKKHTFSPEHIQHSYLKLINFCMSLVQELDAKLYEQLQNKFVLRQISDARALCEMEDCLRDTVCFLKNNQGKREAIGNYTIKKAINYIREHYMEGISLEDVARWLEITPEYLSTLFNKEVGINFTAFLKEFRISHAKRLLKGTDMKIYEVAGAVGYQDPKYFMRVFKEVLGVSPKEYRQNS